MTPREVAEQAVTLLEKQARHPDKVAKLREALKTYDERDSLFYGQPGDEEYACSLEDYLDNDCWEVGEEVEIHVFRRKTISASWIRKMAERITQTWQEDFDEEYGRIYGDGGDDDHGAREQDLMRTLLMWSERAVVWQCEPTGEVIRVLVTENGYYLLPDEPKITSL